MKQFIEHLGLGDGLGNTSSWRVVMYLLIGFWMYVKVHNSFLTGQPIAITPEDLAYLGMVVGGKLIQNRQENSGSTPAQ